MQEANNFRFDYGKPIIYSNKVLLGNWVEEREKYKKHHLKHNSTYRSHFTQKIVDPTEQEQKYRDIKSKGEGAGSVYPKEIEGDFPSYKDNFSTTYDLSYNHFPIWFKGPIDRKMRFRLLKHEPTEEYANSYGNLTKFGLMDYKNGKWKCEIVDPGVLNTTTSVDSYSKPGKKSYEFFRWNRPTVVTAKCGKVSEKTHRPYPSFHPSFSNCNPITWECKVPEHEGQRCVRN